MNQPYRGLGEWWAVQRRSAEEEAKMASPVHHTALAEGSWDAGPNMRRLPSPMTTAVAKRMFALIDSSKIEDGKVTKDACSLPHHEVDADGNPGPANLAGVRNALARLGQVQGFSDADKAAAQRHLQAHLDDQPNRNNDSTTSQETKMTIERLVVPIEWKDAAEGDGTLEGYAATYDLDLGGDVIVKGAFRKTISNIKANGIPLLADHMPSVNSVLGTIYDAHEDGKGLKIKARFSSAASAQDARTKLVEGHVNKMSIGYQPMDWAFEDRDGMTVRVLKEIKLWETSVVVFPMNPEAVISRVKSMVDTLDLNDETKKALSTAGIDYDAMVEEAKAARATAVRDAVLSDQNSTADEAGGSDDESEEKAGDSPATSTDEDEEPDDESAEIKGYDHWRSEAVLNGSDPSETVDPVDRARLSQLLELEESSSIYHTLDPIAREELDRRLRATDSEVNQTRRRFSHPSNEQREE